MIFSDVVDFLGKQLKARQYVPLPTFDPGPSSNAQLWKISPAGLIVFISIGDGRGFETEQIFDQPFIRIRTVSKQNDYAGAEKLANDVDAALCSVVTNTMVGKALTRFINRTGGGPSLLLMDESKRYHFTCTYITTTVTGF